MTEKAVRSSKKSARAGVTGKKPVTRKKKEKILLPCSIVTGLYKNRMT